MLTSPVATGTAVATEDVLAAFATTAPDDGLRIHQESIAEGEPECDPAFLALARLFAPRVEVSAKARCGSLRHPFRKITMPPVGRFTDRGQGRMAAWRKALLHEVAHAAAHMRRAVTPMICRNGYLVYPTILALDLAVQIANNNLWDLWWVRSLTILVQLAVLAAAALLRAFEEAVAEMTAAALMRRLGLADDVPVAALDYVAHWICWFPLWTDRWALRVAKREAAVRVDLIERVIAEHGLQLVATPGPDPAGCTIATPQAA